ncbi:hypothetical protein C2G38_2196300 [Gigaspora rosea]|uniref:Uncharacterized protein n=1 Tax=Gigaspora rosea TaxID=44941 RepID=A0A397UXV7_9GLOM|nr:hypothetical protein C2G38_2196300 [Gigaspora rosea]
MVKVAKQLVFLYYFICSIRNKFVNNAKRDLGIYLDSTGVPNSTIDTLAVLGLTTMSRSIAYHKDSVSEKHLATVKTNLEASSNSTLLLNIDDYHSIHSIKMTTTTTTSTLAHLATILFNLIKTQLPIPRQDIHNFKLVDNILLKTEIEKQFMSTYSLSHNQRWGFRSVDNETRLEELTVHSYNAIDIAVSVPTINKYIENGNVIPVIADWPGQIHLRTAISRYLTHGSSSGITNKVLSFLSMIGPLHISLNSRELIFCQYQPFFSEITWQEIAKMVEINFGYMCKDAEYLILKDLLDNMILLHKNYTETPLMFFSDFFYWESKNHSILEAMKAELPKFSDILVKIFYSLLRHSTETYHTAEQIIKEVQYINYLQFNDDGFKESFAHNSMWAVYQYSSRNIETLSRKTACFLLNCFLEIYTHIKYKKLQFSIPPRVAIVRPLKKERKNLRKLDSNENVESKNPDSSPEDDDLPKEEDNTRESADNISVLWDDTIWKFLLL